MENNENEIKTENLSVETSASSASPNAESVDQNDLADTESESQSNLPDTEEETKNAESSVEGAAEKDFQIDNADGIENDFEDKFSQSENESKTENDDFSAKNDDFSTQNEEDLQNLDSQMAEEKQHNQNDSFFDNGEPQSIFEIYFNSLKERMCFVNSLVYTGLICLVSLFGAIFFGRVRHGFADDISMANSCKILMIFFIVVFVIVFALFIFGIVMNIQRIKHDKNKKRK